MRRGRRREGAGVDVLVPRSRLMTNSLFLATEDRYVCKTKVVAKCYPRPILWQLPRHKRTKTQHEPQYRKCTNSRHVKSDGCAQDVQSMYVYQDADMCDTVTRGSLHIQVLFTW